MLKKIKDFLSRDFEQERIQRYLNESTDIYDLEFRMREIDTSQRQKHMMGGHLGNQHRQQF